MGKLRNTINPRLTRGVSRVDLHLLLAILVLTAFGLVMVQSAGGYFSAVSNQFGKDMYAMLKSQLKWTAVGLVLMFVVSRIDYHIFYYLGFWAYLLAGVVICCLQIGGDGFIHGITRDEATRWLAVGPLSFQVADPVKLALVVSMAALIVRMKKGINHLWGILIEMILGGILAGLILKISSNLSTALILAAITVGMAFVASRAWGYFAAGAAATVGGVIYFYRYLLATIPSGAEIETMSYRWKRLYAWVDPFNPEFMGTVSYQTVQSLYAVGRGGLFGVGLGNSLQKLGSIPEAYNDMIFAVIVEELGFVGAVLILLLFAYLIYQITAIAVRAEDKFGRLLASGVMIHVAAQTVLNVAVTLNLIPNTGIGLPFFSYGGTSAVFMYIELGIVFSVWRTGIIMKKEKAEAAEKATRENIENAVKEATGTATAAASGENHYE